MAPSLTRNNRVEQASEQRNLPTLLLTSIKARIQYYHSTVPLSGLVPQILIDVLAKMRIFVQPYHLVAEGIRNAGPRPAAGKFTEFEFGFLGPQDMPAIASIPGRGLSLAQLLSRLQEGKLCFGAKYHGEVVAFTWWNLTEGTIWSHPIFPLKEHEAFLFDAYTLERFRGMGIAPYLRYCCYEELAKLGRDRCYSTTAVWNPSAAKFKKKLGAQVLELGVFVNLFCRWPFHLRLRDYTRGQQ
jgi:GNAT superfamily N-acetyltransferase